MARPSISRAVVRLPASSSKNPARLEFPDGKTIKLSDAAYNQFLTTFTPFALPLSRGGTALVIPEKRGRGGRYWVARAYEHGAREAVYVGAKPDADSLRRAQVELSGRLHAQAVSVSLLGLERASSNEAAGSGGGDIEESVLDRHDANDVTETSSVRSSAETRVYSPSSQAALDLLAAWERFQAASTSNGGPSEEELLASAADVLRDIRASRP